MLTIIVTTGRARDVAEADSPEAAVTAALTLLREQADHAGRSARQAAYFLGPDGKAVAGPLSYRDLCGAVA